LTAVDDLSRLRAVLADRFEIQRELGHGGTATVYLARDRKLGRQVALKVLSPALAAALGTERFQREIEIAARLNHPHILQLHDSGEVEGRLFYVMPVVEGESLRQRLDREGRLPVSEAVRLAAEVAAALDYAHRQGIVHRDIKPENILLHTGQAIVADFGIARVVDAAAGEAGSRSGITSTGVVLGTPLYMSPEQITGDPVDGRTDVYALGCVLYEMLAGTPPFTGRTAQAVLVRHTVGPVPSLRKMRPELPAEIERAVATALAKVPADRFASAAAFRDALMGFALPPGRRASRRLVHPAVLTLAIGALALGAIFWVATRRAAPPTSPSVAVLPFVNQSSNSNDQYLADGMTDELINALGRVPGLRVASRTSVFALWGSGLDTRKIGAKLNAAMLLEGAVQRAGSTLRVSAQLINADTGYVLWSETYRREVNEIIDVEDEISHAIVQALQLRLAAGDRPLVQRGTENADAYDLYLKGRYFWNLRGSGPPALRRAIGFFEQALALDSAFARAWAGLADAYSLLPGFGDAPPGTAFPAAKDAALRALRLDNALAEAHTSLGIINVFYDWNWAAAQREFERAVALDSTDARTHLFYAWYYNGVARYEDALRELGTAQRLDPTSLVINARLGTQLYYLHRYDEAAAVLRQALALDSTNVIAAAEMGRVLLQQQRFAEALAVLPRDVDLQAGYLGGGILGYAYGREGRRADALATQRRLGARARARYITPEAFAFISIGLGDTAQALDWLERGYRERSFYLVFLNDPIYDPLRKSARFQAMVRGVGLRIAPLPGP
jgi:eukaryotic-like serine/threonine-protein kinase